MSPPKLKPPGLLRHPAFFYLFMLAGAGLLIWFVLQQAPLLESAKGVVPFSPAASPSPWSGLAEHLQQPISRFFIQLLTILVACRLLGSLALRLGQPPVMGEILAGILLGPSLLGLLLPDFSAFLFPADSFQVLQLVSQLGLALFMFIVGMELDLDSVREKTQAAVLISHASIVFPYMLGVILALFLYPVYAPGQISFLAFALFMGIAMSITAFPVLARILREKGLSRTTFGTMALTCAAVDDATAWCLLAMVVAIVKAHSLQGALLTVGLAVAYVGFMFRFVRPWLRRWLLGATDPGRPEHGQVAAVLILLLASALVTELIGIHALFGAFIAGVVMPAPAAFRHALAQKLEDLSLLVLLPLFFAFTGLRTQIGLLGEPGLWVACGLIVLVAVLGKFGGTLAAARFTGLPWGDACRLGALMNTRGLMELVVLNIGYDLGILSGEVFTMMVLMALITTFATGPALALIDRLEGRFLRRPGQQTHRPVP